LVSSVYTIMDRLIVRPARVTSIPKLIIENGQYVGLLSTYWVDCGIKNRRPTGIGGDFGMGTEWGSP